MQPERSYTPEEDDARSDWGVLVLLVGQDDQRPWSVEEIVREQGDEIAAKDSLDQLYKSGLIHRTVDGLVFPTRAALHYHAIRR